MSKINISLVGGQPMPIYVGIQATQCEQQILVHSEGTNGSLPDALLIKKNCGKPSSLYSLPATDYNRICLFVEALLKSVAEHEVWVNVAGGTKPWSIAFAMLSIGMSN